MTFLENSISTQKAFIIKKLRAQTSKELSPSLLPISRKIMFSKLDINFQGIYFSSWMITENHNFKKHDSRKFGVLLIEAPFCLPLKTITIWIKGKQNSCCSRMTRQKLKTQVGVPSHKNAAGVRLVSISQIQSCHREGYQPSIPSNKISWKAFIRTHFHGHLGGSVG